MRLPLRASSCTQKCVALVPEGTAAIVDMDGQAIPQKQSATCLGGSFWHPTCPRAELTRRVAIASATFKQLQIFWRKATAPFAVKYRSFEAIVVAQLLFALATLPMTATMDRTVDTFFHRCLRSLLQLPSTYIDRTFTHAYLRNEVQRRLSARKTLSPISQRLRARRLKWLGHLLRAHETNALRSVILHSDTHTPRFPPIRRVGRPRTNWVGQLMRMALQDIENTPQDMCNMAFEQSEIEALLLAAEARLAPFDVA